MKNIMFSLLSIILLLSCDKQPRNTNTNKNDIKISIIKIFPSKENTNPIEIIVNYNTNEILICNNEIDITRYITTPPKNPKYTTTKESNIVKNEISIKTDLIKLTKTEILSIRKTIESFTTDDFKSKYKDLKDGMAVSLIFVYDNDYKDIELINDFSERHISLIKEVLNILNLRSVNSEYLKEHYIKY